MVPKKSFLKKVYFILVGTLLLEIFLQIIGLARWQWTLESQANDQATSSKVILCIGESTTAAGLDASYPALLQKKLDLMYGRKKYKVVNAGVPGTTTGGVVVALAEKIKIYKPDYVITMLGVNDILLYSGKNSIVNNLKIYSLLKYLKEMLFYEGTKFDFDVYSDFYSNNLVSDLKISVEEAEAQRAYDRQDFELAESLYQSLPRDHNPSESMLWNLAIISSVNGNRENARQYFNKLLEIRDDVKVNYSVAWFFINHYPPTSVEAARALELAKRALDLEPNNLRIIQFMGQIYKNVLRQLNEAEHFYIKADKLKSCNLGVTVGLSDLYQKQDRNVQAIKTLEQCADSDDFGSYDLLRRLINLYLKENRIEEAKSLVLKAKERIPDYVMFSLLERKIFKTGATNVSWSFLENETTIKNYQKIANIIADSKAKHIAMQYPLNDIQALKSILNSPDIVFVNNFDNFKQALTKHKYEEIFYDKFADDFGHATKLGNEILVDQLVNTLIKEKILPQTE